MPLEPERAVAHALSVPATSDRVVRWLIRLRGISPGSGGSMEEFLTTGHFRLLRRRPAEFVSGLAGAVWSARARGRWLRESNEFAGWDEPGTVRVVFTLFARGDARGSRLVTETAIQPTDEAAARAFRRYWLAVAPFSKLIRRRWLREIERRARRIAAS